MKSTGHAKKHNILRRAQDLIGREQLAKRLRIPDSVLDAWVRGDATMPDGRLLDLAAALAEIAGPQKR